MSFRGVTHPDLLREMLPDLLLPRLADVCRVWAWRGSERRESIAWHTSTGRRFLNARHQFFLRQTKPTASQSARMMGSSARLENCGRACRRLAVTGPAWHRLTSVCPRCVRPHAELQAARSVCRSNPVCGGFSHGACFVLLGGDGGGGCGFAGIAYERRTVDSVQ